jgi:hypothetical protein
MLRKRSFFTGETTTTERENLKVLQRWWIIE